MNRRQKEILKYSLEEENRILHRLTDAYKGAAEDIRKKIEKLMGSVPKLQSRIYQARFQKALRSNIDDVLNKLRNGTYKTLSDFLDSSYEDGFIASIYDMQGQGVPLIFPVDPDQMYRAVTLNSRLSKGLYTKLGFDINVLKKEIREELSRGIAAGKMIDDLAKAIDRRTSVGLGKAKRIARTEARRIQNEAAYDAQLKAKENGADVLKEWCAILDSKTRPDHRELHGQRKELDEYFEVNGHRALHPSGFGIASEDINCRCVLLQRARWAVEDEEEAVKDTEAIVKKSEAKGFSAFKRDQKELSPIPSDWKYSSRVRGFSIDRQLKIVNPNFNKTSMAWSNNCQRCVPTYEMRRRGYDVEAKPFVSDYDKVMWSWNKVFEDADFLLINRRDNEKAIQELMKEWGEGARAEIYVEWKNSHSAHVFVAEQVNGVTRFIDPQNGDGNVSHYFRLCKPLKTKIARIDNLKPSSLIDDCASSRKNKKRDKE